MPAICAATGATIFLQHGPMTDAYMFERRLLIEIWASMRIWVSVAESLVQKEVQLEHDRLAQSLADRRPISKQDLNRFRKAPAWTKSSLQIQTVPLLLDLQL